MTKTIIILFLTFCFCANAQVAQKEQTPEDVDRQFQAALEAKMKKDREMIERFMNDDVFKKFDQMFEKMVQDLDQGKFEGLQQFFDPKNFDQFLGDSELAKNLGLGEGKWIENPSERILVLKIARKEEEPLKIDIKDGKVLVSGEVTTSEERTDLRGRRTVVESMRKIDQSYLIPGDVDASNPKFENKDGSILIRFAKKTAESSRQQLKPDSDDITI